MWIQREHGDAWVGDAEVTAQRQVENGCLLNDSFLGDGLCHVLNGQVGSHQSYAQGFVHQNHEGFLAFAHTGLDILRVSRKLKFWTLDGGLVDGRRDQYVVQFVSEVGHRLVECFQGSQTSLFRGLTNLDLHVFIEAVQQVQTSVACFFGMVDDAEVRLQVERFAVIGGNLGRSINNGCAEFKHSGV